MIPIVIIICSILGGLLFWYIKKDIVNPVTIFLFEWAIVIFLASLRLYDLTYISNKAYSLVLIGIVFYFIGSLLGNIIKIKSNDQKTKKYEINYTLQKIAAIIIIVYSLYRIKNIITFLSNGYSWWEIRLMATSGEGGIGTIKGSNLAIFLHDSLVAPLIYLIVPIAIVDFFVGKRNKMAIILTIIAMFLYSISTVSRAIWAFSIIYILFIFLLYKKKHILSKKVKRALKLSPIIIIVLCFIIYKITLARNSEANFLVNAYAYITGCMPLLTIHLEESISSIRTFGMLSLNGFLYPIFFILNYIHILSYPQAFTNAIMIKRNLETFYSISPQIRMNAYSTLFYNFYIDFGYLGVALGSAIFGFICIKVFNHFKKDKNIKDLVLYLILSQFIIFSVARIYTSLSTRALSLIWIIFMFKPVINSKNE